MSDNPKLQLGFTKLIYADGAMGTVLQSKGFAHGCPDELNLTNPALISSIHKEYAQAGANILFTNTFGANRLKLSQYNLHSKLAEINKAGVNLARQAAPGCIIAGDIGELGEYVEPIGNLTFDQAYQLYKEQIETLKDCDIYIIETISDIKLLKAALIAAKETNKCVIASMTFQNDGRTSTGTDVQTFVKIADALGADVIGANCSTGPDKMLEIARIITQNTNKSVMIKANAGVPDLNHKLVFDKQVFADFVKKYVELGVNIVGGCCGTDPEYIKAIVSATKNLTPKKRNNVLPVCFCSRTRTVEFQNKPLVVGERINPSGRKEFREELKQGKMNYVRNEAVAQSNEGADLLDMNVGVPNTKETENMATAVCIVQNVSSCPIVIDTCSKEALINALKQCDGKPLINSVNLKNMDEILPIAKKYGAGVIALCLSDSIPKTVDERLEIAKKITSKAQDYNIKDIIVDPLTLTIATNPENENVLLECIKRLKQLSYKTILGISNISFGLPNRSEVNQKFFTKAVKAGLDFAIISPLDVKLHENTDIIIERQYANYANQTDEQKLKTAIIYGDKENILQLIEECLRHHSVYELNDILISALGEVGVRFKSKQIFLPQVLLAAETMKLAFDRLKSSWPKEKSNQARIVFATVENDIHDIGKNITITILESHGYKIIDLGKSVPVAKIIETALNEKASIIALSALMTTTAPEMEKLVSELKARKLNIPVIIGGAVITQDYAEDIGAAYSADALSSVKVIESILK